METILDNNNAQQTEERDITPIDVSQHTGIEDLIDLASALQPVMDATQALYVMTAPQGSQFRTTTDAWIYE